MSATVSGVFTSHVAQNRQSSLALDMIALEEFVIAYVTNVTARISKKRMRKAGVAVAHRVVVSKIAFPHVYLVTVKSLAASPVQNNARPVHPRSHIPKLCGKTQLSLPHVT